MAKVVKAPLVIVTDEETGARQHVYGGTPLPSFVKGDQLKHLEDLGFLEDAKEDDGASSSRKSSSSK